MAMNNLDPRMIEAYELAEAHAGLAEVKGPKHEQRIVDMFAAVGHSWVKDDETAWCAAFVGAILERCGVKSTKALNARSYLEWGEPVSIEDAQRGDIVVFSRGDPNGWQGHVGFYNSHGKTFVNVLGGNQSDQVKFSNYKRSILLGVRRLPYRAPATQNPFAALIAALLAIFGKAKK